VRQRDTSSKGDVGCTLMAATWKAVLLRVSALFTSAPRLTNSSTTGVWPFPALLCSAVHPFLSTRERSAPWSSRYSTTPTWPFSAARYSGVQPSRSLHVFTLSFPFSTVNCTTSIRPFCAASTNSLALPAGLRSLPPTLPLPLPFPPASVRGDKLPLVPLLTDCKLHFDDHLPLSAKLLCVTSMAESSFLLLLLLRPEAAGSTKRRRLPTPAGERSAAADGDGADGDIGVGSPGVTGRLLSSVMVSIAVCELRRFALSSFCEVLAAVSMALAQSNRGLDPTLKQGLPSSSPALQRGQPDRAMDF